MTASTPALFELTEHASSYFDSQELTSSQGRLLFQRFGNYLDVEFPSPPTGDRWRITPKGWVGAFPLDDTATFVARPKLPIRNLARMLGLVYELPVHSFPELVSCQTLPELYDQLALFLAGRAHQVLMGGPHQAYRSTTKSLTAIRGRLDIPTAIRRPVTSGTPCRFDQRTGDTIENEAILWTFERILRSGLCSEATRERCRDVYRRFLNVATVRKVESEELRAVRYTRLTERYRIPHALCLLFLENSAPIVDTGNIETVPFLFSMPVLFESFVAKWLERRLRSAKTGLNLRKQERSRVGTTASVGFTIDLVLYDDLSGRAVCVLDTKYKDVAAPASDDVAQIGYYALLKGCELGGLVYPVSVMHEWEGMSGAVSTFRSSFALDYDLEAAGERFFADLRARLEV